MDNPARIATFLGQLESRRTSIDQAMWQGPTLTIAAQAFLLTVLTDKDVADDARFWILVAGAAACIAAILSLVRLRAREVLYSEAIAFVCEDAGIPAPWPFGLQTKSVRSERQRPFNKWPFVRPEDRIVRSVGGFKLLPTVYLFWIAALVLFVVADVIAYRATA